MACHFHVKEKDKNEETGVHHPTGQHLRLPKVLQTQETVVSGRCQQHLHMLEGDLRLFDF